MFRRLIMAIFRLYMKYLLSSYTKHTWAVYMGKGGGKVGTRSSICQKHAAVPYVENTLYSTNKNGCARPVHTLYIGYFGIKVI